jgi:mRNA-degrading endonuclease RelE of RelBE toxin-antitoxin system
MKLRWGKPGPGRKFGMNYEIYLPQTFQRCVKLLKKKFPHIKDDLSSLFQQLQNNPEAGDPIPGWHRTIWKVRVSSTDLKKGKSGGFRVIYFWSVGEATLYPLFVYFKGEKEDITKAEIETLLKKLSIELDKC